MTWSPSGKTITQVMDGSVCESDVVSGETRRLTVARAGADAPLDQVCVYSPAGDEIAFTRMVINRLSLCRLCRTGGGSDLAPHDLGIIGGA